MKKAYLIGWMVAIYITSTVALAAPDMPGRRDYIGEGISQSYIGYQNKASGGTCGTTIERLELQGWDVPESSYWNLVISGQETRGGIFRFESNGCSAGFTIEGTVHEWEYQGGWGSISITSEDIFLLYGEDIFGPEAKFRKKIKKLERQGASFHLVQLREWNKVFLKDLAASMVGTTYVGAILPNDRGFLQKIVMGLPPDFQASYDLPLVLIFMD